MVAGEFKLPRRLGGFGASDRFIEGVDRKPAVGFDRLAVGAVKHQPAAQPAHHRFAGALIRHLAPKGDDPGGLWSRFGRGGLRRFRWPARIVALKHAPARAAGKCRE
jgi:hypothetical protein